MFINYRNKWYNTYYTNIRWCPFSAFPQLNLFLCANTRSFTRSLTRSFVYNQARDITCNILIPQLHCILIHVCKISFLHLGPRSVSPTVPSCPRPGLVDPASGLYDRGLPPTCPPYTTTAPPDCTQTSPGEIKLRSKRPQEYY